METQTSAAHGPHIIGGMEEKRRTDAVRHANNADSQAQRQEDVREPSAEDDKFWLARVLTRAQALAAVAISVVVAISAFVGVGASVSIAPILGASVGAFVGTVLNADSANAIHVGIAGVVAGIVASIGSFVCAIDIIFIFSIFSISNIAGYYIVVAISASVGIWVADYAKRISGNPWRTGFVFIGSIVAISVLLFAHFVPSRTWNRNIQVVCASFALIGFLLEHIQQLSENPAKWKACAEGLGTSLEFFGMWITLILLFN